jgi:Ca-activated chloride channel family protein
MRKAAVIGRGSHTHIGRLDEVTQRMGSLWQRIENPALQDICIDWGSDAEYFPDIVPDLYAGEPLWLLARLPHEPREVRVCGNLNGEPWEQLAQPLPGKGSENIAQLWARSKIEALQDSRLFGLDAELRLEVSALAIEFGLIPYTSCSRSTTPRARQCGCAARDPNPLPAGSSAIQWASRPLKTISSAVIDITCHLLLLPACCGSALPPPRGKVTNPAAQPGSHPQRYGRMPHSAAYPVLAVPQIAG